MRGFAQSVNFGKSLAQLVSLGGGEILGEGSGVEKLDDQLNIIK